jgi:hypothetical protein
VTFEERARETERQLLALPEEERLKAKNAIINEVGRERIFLTEGRVAELVRDPLTIERGRHDGDPVATPEDVVGEQHMITLLLHALGEPHQFLAKPIDEAIPFLWTDEMRVTAAALDDLPRHVVSKAIMPYDRMWWTWQGSVPLHLDGQEMWCDGILLLNVGLGIQASFVYEIEEGAQMTTITMPRIEYGSTYPNDFLGEKKNATIILQMLAFLNSPYVSAELRSVNRARRREQARAQVPVATGAHFIVLRNEAKAHAPHDDSDGRDWKNRWWVRGHFRAQWYPSEGAHHVIWVAPYIKGPEDAPVKTPVYKVAR